MALQEADFGSTDLAMNHARTHGDETLLVKFYTAPRQSITKSKEMGRPIFEETTYIQIMTPGNKDHIVIRPATERDKQRFAEHYRKFTAREDQEAVEGTILEEWAAVSRSQVNELKHLNIRTVEQLANVSDSNGQGIMGVQVLKEKAIKWLSQAEKNATAEKMAALEEKYQSLLERVEGEEAPKKRGRPKKETTPEE